MSWDVMSKEFREDGLRMGNLGNRNLASVG